MKRGFILVLIVTLAGFARAQGEGDEETNYGTSIQQNTTQHYKGIPATCNRTEETKELC